MTDAHPRQGVAMKQMRSMKEVGVVKALSRGFENYVKVASNFSERITALFIALVLRTRVKTKKVMECGFTEKELKSDRGDVPGWVLVVLMTTGLVTAIWTIAAPRLTAILRNSLDSMNGIR